CAWRPTFLFLFSRTRVGCCRSVPAGNRKERPTMPSMLPRSPHLRKLIALCVLFLSSPATPAAPERVPLLFDSAIGSEIDEPFALALILGSPEVELRGVTTVTGNPQQRAMMLCRFLPMTGRRHTPVAAGAEPQPPREITGQYQYYYHP